tara:strand:- start:270 stop:953 length:684 start_codon:yes stop_codon:yes gene_type:complete
MDEKNCAGIANEDVLEYLQSRRSLSVKYMADEALSHAEIDTILKTAARVPDHGKLMPWYFVVFEGERRREVGAVLREAYKSEDPDASAAKLDLEAQRFMRAPLVIMVVSRMRKGKHALWEQFLSAGALCQNMLLAANALGYGGNWLTEWYSYNDAFRDKIGLDRRDNIAGVMYIGKAAQQPEGRPRPEMDAITTYWNGTQALQKGDERYDHDKFDIPNARIFGLKDK